MDLIIIRHAQPLRSAETADPELSELGHRQASAVGQRLSNEPISAIIASSMHRARQTAEPTAARLGLNIALRDDLREADEHTGSYIPSEEMNPDDEVVKRFIQDPYLLFEHGYEPFAKKVVNGFEEIIANHRGQTVAVFCHGLVIAAYIDHLWQLGDPFKPHVDYTGITRVRASSTGLRTVRAMNDTGHVVEPH